MDERRDVVEPSRDVLLLAMLLLVCLGKADHGRHVLVDVFSEDGIVGMIWHICLG